MVASATYPLDIRFLTFLVGVDAGAALLRETFDAPRRTTPTRRGVASFFGIATGVDWNIANALQLQVRSSLRAYLFHEDMEAGPALRVSRVPSLSAGFAWLWAI